MGATFSKRSSRRSLGFSNVILGIGGAIGFVFIGYFELANLIPLSFIIFGLLLIITGVPIFFLTDLGNYTTFSLSSAFESLINTTKGNIKENFFLSKPIIQVSIHWIAFSAIISFGTFFIPILELVVEEIPTDVTIPLELLLLIVISLIISIVGGLLFWGRVSDTWKIRPVLLIGFIGTCFLVGYITILLEFNLIAPLLNGLQSSDPLSILAIAVFILCLFATISLIPTPMIWITTIIGENDLGKALSLRMALIAVGTIIGTIIGPFVIVNYGISGILIIILIFLLISAIIII